MDIGGSVLMTIDLTQATNPDWLDALQVLRRSVEGSVKPVWKKYFPQFVVDPTPLGLASLSEPQPIGDDDAFQLIISTPQDFILYPRIERIEMLLWSAVCCYQAEWSGIHPLQFMERFADSRDTLCRKVGCCWTNEHSTRERWRLIEFFSPSHLLPYSNFEDRQTCAVCKQIVSTGAGAWARRRGSEWREVSASEEEIESWKNLPFGERQAANMQGAGLNYIPNLHDECLRYTHRMLKELKS